jgi:translation elongation factor EF-G
MVQNVKWKKRRMGQKAEWSKASNGKTLNGKKAEWYKMSNGKIADWDKTLNEKTLNGTKRQIENRKEKYK